MTPKEKASKWCSRYIRLRDAIAYCLEHGIDLGQFTRPEDVIGSCATCGAVKSWIRQDAGHWIGRGLGGGSGVYFDERNISLQCKPCNAWEGGRAKDHEKYILKKYGQKIIDELERKHYMRIDMRAIAMKAMEIFYHEKYDELVLAHGL